MDNQNQMPENMNNQQAMNNQQVPVPTSNRTNGFAIAGFVLALLCGGIISLIFSIIGLVQINKRNEGGKGLAIAGIVISIIKIIFAIIYLILFGGLIIKAVEYQEKLCPMLDENGYYQEVIDEEDNVSINCEDFTCTLTYPERNFEYTIDCK